MRQIAVAVLDRVGEHVAHPARRAGVARVRCSRRPRPASACRRLPWITVFASTDRRRIGIAVVRNNRRHHRAVGAQHVRNAVSVLPAIPRRRS